MMTKMTNPADAPPLAPPDAVKTFLLEYHGIGEPHLKAPAWKRQIQIETNLIAAWEAVTPAGERIAPRELDESICGCGHRQSFHRVDINLGSVYCQLAKARFRAAGAVHEVAANVPSGLSAHDHGNCELCDWIEAKLAKVGAEVAGLTTRLAALE